MKKIFISLFFVVFGLFLCINYNVFAIEMEEKTDVEHNSIIYDDIYNGKIGYLETDNTLYLSYYYENEINSFSLEDYQFYRNTEDTKLITVVYIAPLTPEKSSNSLIVDSYIRPDDDSIFFQLTIYKEEHEKLLRLWFLQEKEILNTLNILEYNSNDLEVVNSLNMMKKLFRELKNYYQSISMYSSDETVLYAKRKLTGCNDAEILNYRANSNNSYNPDNTVKDDPIVNYIPRQYFLTICEKIDYGSEYGYYIKTIEEATNCFTSYVSVFRVEYSFPKDTGGGDDLPHDLVLHFIPIFNHNFSAYKKDSNTSKYFSFGTKDSFVLVDTFLLDIGYTDFIFTNKIKNINGLNQCDDGYTKDNDLGLAINSLVYMFENIQNNKLETNYLGDNTFISGSSLFVSWVEPIVDSFTAIQKIIDFAYSNSTKAATYDEDQHFYKISGPTVTSPFNYCKEITTGFNTQQSLNEKYYIGRNNTSLTDISSKVSFKSIVEYSNINKQEIEPQVFNNILITTICSFDFSGISKMATIALMDEGYLTLNLLTLDEYHTHSGTLYSDKQNLFPLYFTESGMKDITITCNSYSSFEIIDSFGKSIYNDYAPANTTYRYSFYANENTRYFIKLTTNTTNSFNYSIVSSVVYSLSTGSTTNTYVYARSTEVYDFYVNSSGYYIFETSSSLDPCLSLYLGTTMVAYNDNSYILDEEGNEEIISDSYLFVHLNPGHYYLVLGNLSNTGGTISLDSR